MKKAYCSPEVDIVSLVGADVICTSVDAGQPNEDDPGFFSSGRYWNVT